MIEAVGTYQRIDLPFAVRTLPSCVRFCPPRENKFRLFHYLAVDDNKWCLGEFSKYVPAGG